VRVGDEAEVEEHHAPACRTFSGSAAGARACDDVAYRPSDEGGAEEGATESAFGDTTVGRRRISRSRGVRSRAYSSSVTPRTRSMVKNHRVPSNASSWSDTRFGCTTSASPRHHRALQARDGVGGSVVQHLERDDRAVLRILHLVHDPERARAEAAEDAEALGAGERFCVVAIHEAP
jgi:hypothetical protein